MRKGSGGKKFGQRNSQFLGFIPTNQIAIFNQASRNSGANVRVEKRGKVYAATCLNPSALHAFWQEVHKLRK